MVELPRQQDFQSKTKRAAEAEPQAAPPEARAAAAAAPPSSRRTIKRIGIAAALMLGAAAAGHFGYQYWMTGQYQVSTDDAYVKADYTTVAPKVSGYIAEVLVADNEHVAAGKVLARIDDRDFRAALAQANAEVEAADAAIRNLDAQIALQQSVIDQAKATVVATQASLTFAQADADRYRQLSKTGSGTVQRAQQTDSILNQTTAQLQRDKAALITAQSKIAVLTTQREQAIAQRDRSRAAEHQADLNLSYTTIVAPVGGTVGARALRVGQYVTTGTQLMAVVPLHAAYVVANFKETQLAHVRAGQPVEISVDGLGGVTLKGHVDSLSPASGLEFSLLPPDNATGNFTKIVQRIPVKILVDDTNIEGLLRSGMSVEPTIDTKAIVLAEAGKPRLPAHADRQVADALAAVQPAAVLTPSSAAR